jgi:hypothetical protein
MAAPLRTPRTAPFAFAMLVVIALSGVILAVGIQAADPGDAASAAGAARAESATPDAPAADGGATDPSARSTLALQGEWFLLKIENAWLDAGDAEARKRNEKRIAAILRELNARGA